MAKKHTSVWKLLQEASLASEIKVTLTNRFVFKSFFPEESCLIKYNWAHTHNFENLLQLVSEYRGKEIQKHQLTSPKNATYFSPTYVAKYISIMNEYTKAPLLKSLINGQFYTLYNEETQGISTTEQLAIYSTFKHNNKISEYYLV